MDIKVLQKDMIAAMKARDKARKESISALIQAVKKAGIDAGCRDDIPEEMVNKVILKELKTVKEQIDSCPADRTDLIEEYQARYDVFNEYAPKLMSAEEVEADGSEPMIDSAHPVRFSQPEEVVEEAELKEKFADVIATKNKGQIMKTVMPAFKGRADGKVINQIVAKMCQ